MRKYTKARRVERLFAVPLKTSLKISLFRQVLNFRKEVWTFIVVMFNHSKVEFKDENKKKNNLR